MLRLRSLDLVVSAFLILFGLYVVVTGFGYGFLDNGTPDAGFFPLFMGLGIILFAGINLFNVLRRHEAFAELIGREELARVVLSSAALILFAIAAAPLGMLVAGFLLMIAIAAIFGAHSRQMILRAALASAIMSGVLYLIFVKFLAIALP